MTLRAYLRVLREQWLLVALFVVAATATAVVVTDLTPKTYQATAQVLVSSKATGNSALQQQANNYVQTQVPTYAKVIDAPDILRGVKSDLNLSLTDSQLAAKIDATSTTGESLVYVTATDPSPELAASLANSAAHNFVSFLHGVNKSVTLVVTGPADQPTSPVSPKPALNISLGVLLGLLLGAAFAVIRDLLDNRIKDTETLAKVADAPLMGTVVDDPATRRQPVASRGDNRSVRAENFRQLRANLQFANVDEYPRIIAVTSSIPEEGKTTVAINLASTLAEAGFSVCLVDTDLRRPMVAQALDLVESAGLTSVLIQQIGLSEVLQDAGSNLFVLASGPTPPNPSEVLASAYVRDVVRSLLDKVDYVVLDTAPLLPVADGSEVAALADGTLLVVRHGVTTEPSVKRAREALRRVDATLLGVVLNRVPQRSRHADYGYAYYRSVPAGTSISEHEAPRRRGLRRGTRAAHSTERGPLS